MKQSLYMYVCTSLYIMNVTIYVRGCLGCYIFNISGQTYCIKIPSKIYSIVTRNIQA